MRDYEHKLLEKEKDWRLSKRTLGENYSSNVWESKNGHIVIEIYKYDSPEEAVKLLQAMKTSPAAGGHVMFRD